MPSNAFAERILQFVQAKGYTPQQLHELAVAMGVGEDELGDFHSACKALMKTGRVVLGGRNALMLPPPAGRVVGIYRANPKGFGFLIPDIPNAHGDFFIPPGKSGDALTGDTVAARVQKRGQRDGKTLYEGQIIEVLQRGRNRFVGELCQQARRWLVVPDGNILHMPIEVGDPGAKNGRVGDKVVVELTTYPGPGREARGAIVKVLGERGRPDVETQAIVEQHQLPGEFGDDVIRETQRVIEAFDVDAAAKGREDLRDLTVITIDPNDARDFDDAISITKNRSGTVELGVHIADVGYFVREGGALDAEAKERSTSVYLPRTVIPMLPEALSNGLCSLQERQTRVTKSAFITYDARGKVKSERVANTIIRSAKRLTYEQASAILDGKPGRTSAEIVALLKEMERLAIAIRKRRLAEGMLELDLPEVDLVHGEDGGVVDVKPADTSFSHKIIEMFMVEANEAVARTLNAKKVPFLRRVHDEPRDLASGTLRRFLSVLGHQLPEDANRFAVQKLLDSVRGRPDSFAVHLAVLRSMQQAEYAPSTKGHFALASKHYAHFTSPIRRYPDLTIHRLFDLQVRGELAKRKRAGEIPSEEALVQLGRQCSTNERRAEAAERELRMVLLLKLLEEKHLGEEFSGIVTGVANVGVFVQLERFLIDGLLRFDGLPDDWWEVDPTRGCVVGERSGVRITVGDRLKVSIARVHLPTRRMELGLAEPLKAGRPGRRSDKQEGRGRDDRRSPRGGRGRGKAPATTGGGRSRGGRSSAGAKTGAKPGTKPAAKSSTKPATESGKKPVSKAAGKPAAKPGTKPTTRPAAKPGTKSVARPGAKGTSGGGKPSRTGKKPKRRR